MNIYGKGFGYKLRLVLDSMYCQVRYCLSIILLMLFILLPSAYAENLLNIEISQQGVYRLDHQRLLNAGLDLRGIALERIGLKRDEVLVPIKINGLSSEVFGADSSIEYIGDVETTMYHGHDVYTLVLDQGQRLIQSDDRAIDSTVGPAYSYLAEAYYGAQNHYSSISPDPSDGWYAHRLKALNSPVSTSVQLTIDNYAPSFNTGFSFGSGSNLRPVQLADVKPSIYGRFWGASSLPGNGLSNPDHEVQLVLNGEEVIRKTFDGLKLLEIDQPLGALSDGVQYLEIRLPFEHGYNFDIVDVDSVSIKYPRRFVAELDGHGLIFPSKWKKFRVRGLLPSPSYTVYRKTAAGDVYEMLQQELSCNSNSCSLIFAGEESDVDAHYYVFSEQGILTSSQSIAIAPRVDDILSGEAEYLLITHPDFIGTQSGALEYLHQDLRRLYNTVDIVSVEQIYAQYSGHKVDANAIYAYLKDAYELRNTRYVTLVGDDNYDYLNYVYENAISYIPSLYVQISHNMNFVPSDAKYADVLGDDDVPDIAISRLPVRTEADLLRLINKRYNYLISTNRNRVLLSTDEVDGNNYNFKSKLTSLLTGDLFRDFSVQGIHLDDLDASSAKSQLLTAMNAGASLVTYFGHSSVDRWSFSNLFSSSDISRLTNVSSPSIVMQLGCWNNYYVDPSHDSIGARLLLQSDAGAVTVMGATTLTQADSEYRLAEKLLPKLSAKQSIGDALLEAKQELGASGGNYEDILLGWSVLGFLDLTVSLPN